jgi:segregation and condensation protein B
MSLESLKPTLEAAIMASSEPLAVNDMLALFDGDLERPDRDAVRAVLDQLQSDYTGRGIELVEVASGYRFQVRSRYAEWVNRLFDEKPQRYSRALLETLAIIAYRQPITRAEIENVRGVSVSTGIIKTLQEREWVRVVGNREVPGRPELLATTRQFLDYFNLKSLSDLPTLAEVKDFDKMNPDLFEGMDLPPVKIGAMVADAGAEADAGGEYGNDNRPAEDNVVPFVPASGD